MPTPVAARFDSPPHSPTLHAASGHVFLPSEHPANPKIGQIAFSHDVPTKPFTSPHSIPFHQRRGIVILGPSRSGSHSNYNPQNTTSVDEDSSSALEFESITSGETVPEDDLEGLQHQIYQTLKGYYASPFHPFGDNIVDPLTDDPADVAIKSAALSPATVTMRRGSVTCSEPLATPGANGNPASSRLASPSYCPLKSPRSPGLAHQTSSPPRPNKNAGSTDPQRDPKDRRSSAPESSPRLSALSLGSSRFAALVHSHQRLDCPPPPPPLPLAPPKPLPPSQLGGSNQAPVGTTTFVEGSGFKWSKVEPVQVFGLESPGTDISPDVLDSEEVVIVNPLENVQSPKEEMLSLLSDGSHLRQRAGLQAMNLEILRNHPINHQPVNSPARRLATSLASPGCADRTSRFTHIDPSPADGTDCDSDDRPSRLHHTVARSPRPDRSQGPNFTSRARGFGRISPRTRPRSRATSERMYAVRDSTIVDITDHNLSKEHVRSSSSLTHRRKEELDNRFNFSGLVITRPEQDFPTRPQNPHKPTDASSAHTLQMASRKRLFDRVLNWLNEVDTDPAPPPPPLSPVWVDEYDMIPLAPPAQLDSLIQPVGEPSQRPSRRSRRRPKQGLHELPAREGPDCREEITPIDESPQNAPAPVAVPRYHRYAPVTSPHSFHPHHPFNSLRPGPRPEPGRQDTFILGSPPLPVPTWETGASARRKQYGHDPESRPSVSQHVRTPQQETVRGRMDSSAIYYDHHTQPYPRRHHRDHTPAYRPGKEFQYFEPEPYFDDDDEYTPVRTLHDFDPHDLPGVDITHSIEGMEFQHTPQVLSQPHSRSRPRRGDGGTNGSRTSRSQSFRDRSSSKPRRRAHYHRRTPSPALSPRGPMIVLQDSGPSRR